MNTTFTIPKKEYKAAIREIKLDNIVTGGESALPFMHSEISTKLKPIVAVEILTNLPTNYPEELKDAWGNCIHDPIKWAQTAVEKNVDILAIRFNLTDIKDIEQKIEKCKDQLNQILGAVNIPIMILGSDKREIDQKLLPELAKAATRTCTIGIVIEENYKEIVPAVKEAGHNIIARTPIDINLAKQLNILITELGFDPNKVLIDPNIGGLGYGLDYAYSVIERIKLAALDGDNMLNMPIITFVGEESWKTKEAKSNDNEDSWGSNKTRSVAWECLTASSLLSAGANIAVMYHPESIKYIKNFINKA